MDKIDLRIQKVLVYNQALYKKGKENQILKTQL